MSSDPKSNVPQKSLSETLDAEIDRLLAAGLENFSVRELLGMMISAAGQAERRVYLEENTGDKGNGGYERSLNVGSIPVDFRVPRTRTGKFRPSSLPPPYERGYSEEVHALLLGLLSSARSINAAKAALRKMGLGACSEELDSVASSFVEELELVNSRPIDPDMLAVFVDGETPADTSIRKKPPSSSSASPSPPSNPGNGDASPRASPLRSRSSMPCSNLASNPSDGDGHNFLDRCRRACGNRFAIPTSRLEKPIGFPTAPTRTLFLRILKIREHDNYPDTGGQ